MRRCSAAVNNGRAENRADAATAQAAAGARAAQQLHRRANAVGVGLSAEDLEEAVAAFKLSRAAAKAAAAPVGV